MNLQNCHPLGILTSWCLGCKWAQPQTRHNNVELRIEIEKAVNARRSLKLKNLALMKSLYILPSIVYEPDRFFYCFSSATRKTYFRKLIVRQSMGKSPSCCQSILILQLYIRNPMASIIRDARQVWNNTNANDISQRLWRNEIY